jgi:hypothetical protein
MSNMKDSLRMFWLRVKAKFNNFIDSKFVQWLVSLDITPLFLFFGIKLLNYIWTWWNLLGCIGIWIVVKEIFNQIKDIARIGANR